MENQDSYSRPQLAGIKASLLLYFELSNGHIDDGSQTIKDSTLEKLQVALNT